MHCPQCSAAVPEGAFSCPSCRYVLPAPAPGSRPRPAVQVSGPPVMNCPQCSAPISAGATVCPSCRYVLPAPARASGPGSVARFAAPASPPQRVTGASALAPASRASEPPALESAVRSQQGPVNMPLQRPFRKLMLGMGAALIALAGYTLVALLLGGHATDAPILLSLIVGATFLIALPILLLFSSAALVAMRRMVAGDYLVHWTYTKAEWEQFTEDSWRQALRLDGWVAGALAVVAVFFALFSSSSDLFLVMLVVTVLVVALMFGSDYWLYTQRRKQETGETLISRAGILRPEGFIPFIGLDSVNLEQGIIKVRVRYRTYQNRMSYTRYRTYEVPVPRGNEDEAAWLVEQLRP